jgi:hypothetical protein
VDLHRLVGAGGPLALHPQDLGDELSDVLGIVDAGRLEPAHHIGRRLGHHLVPAPAQGVGQSGLAGAGGAGENVPSDLCHVTPFASGHGLSG